MVGMLSGANTSCLRSFTSRGRRTTIGNMKPTRYNQQLAVAESRSGCPWQADSAGAIEIGLDESQTAFPQQGEKGRFFLLTSPLIGQLTRPRWPLKSL